MTANSLSIKLYCPNHLRVGWQGHIVLGIAQCFFDQGVNLEVWVRSADLDARRCYVKEGVPRFLGRLLYRFHKENLVSRLTGADS